MNPSSSPSIRVHLRLSAVLVFLVFSPSLGASPERIVLEAENGRLECMNPAVTPRFYKGSRFDASSIITDWTAHGVRLFAPWREPHDPAHPEAVSGPAEEFGFPEPMGFADTPVGGAFMKIGVGLLRRPDAKPYDRNRPYEIIDPGQWQVEPHPDHIVFHHILAHPESGVAYHYEKIVRLEERGAILRIERTLTNTGSVSIETNHYAHNFLSFDALPTHTGYTLEFPVAVQATNQTRENFATIRDRTITFGPDAFGPRSYFAKLATPDDIPLPNRATLRHTEMPLALHIESALPVERVIVFALESAICPEFFITIRLPPGEQSRWDTSYRLAP